MAANVTIEQLNGLPTALEASRLNGAESPPVEFCQLLTPAGPLLAGTQGEHLVSLHFRGGDESVRALTRLAERSRTHVVARATALHRQLAEQLEGYFTGRRHEFNLALHLTGTPFQRAVWEALQRVPWGETVTYSELAGNLGKPRAARAVGRAVGANPVAIVVPCHRVVAAGGRLGGYAGGLPAKQALLAVERA